MKDRRLIALVLVVCILVACGAPALPASAQRMSRVDAVMFQDPPLDIPDAIMTFPSAVRPLWIETLKHDEADLKQQAAFSIIWACNHGFTEWSDAVEPLIKNLRDDSHRIVRLASARTLVELDARDAAAALYGRCQEDGLEMAQIVEPALAVWDFAPIRPVWRERLQQTELPQRLRLLAIRGLGRVRDRQAAEALKELTLDRSHKITLRLAAAEELGRIQPSDLEPTARQLMSQEASAEFIDRLLAARLLRYHESDAAKLLLVQLAVDPEPAVAVTALEKLLEWDPASILPVSELALRQGDARVRRIVADALLACPSESTVTQLGRLLDDPHPDLRRHVCDALVRKAETDELRETVIEQGRLMLAGNDWRGLEQAIRLLTALDQKVNARRYLELLKHPRLEVYVTAAWGLGHLAVPETCAPLLKIAQERYQDRKRLWTSGQGAGIDEQLSQIFQFFGKSRFAPAEDFLRTFVPKVFELEQTRGAAVWALGYYYENKPDKELAAQLEGRLRDAGSMEPELEIVRRFAAVSLGRMNARQALPALREFQESDGIQSESGYACAWSVHRITGETYEPPEQGYVNYRQFFIEPYTP